MLVAARPRARTIDDHVPTVVQPSRDGVLGAELRCGKRCRRVGLM
jgi:hypothetical protein